MQLFPEPGFLTDNSSLETYLLQVSDDGNGHRLSVNRVQYALQKERGCAVTAY